MKRLTRVLLIGSFILMSLLCVINFNTVKARAESSIYEITFDYNINRIKDYIPNDSLILQSLENYSVHINEGGVVVETSKPSSIINMYYSYKWTVDGKVVDLNNFNFTKDTTLVALWTPRVYTVYFHFPSNDIKNKVQNLITTINFTVESPRINLYRPMVDDYSFKGWYDGGSAFEYLYIPERSIGDKNLTARFSLYEYYINYHTDADNYYNPHSYNILDKDIILEPAMKEGHIFEGWFSDEELTKPVTSINCSVGGNINLYPSWSLETYTVTYILPDGSKQEVLVEYGKKVDLPETNKNIFQVIKTNVSRKNITSDTTIEIKYINIWYIYLLVILAISGVVVTIVLVRKKQNNTHNNLRMIYQSNSRKR